MCFHNAPRCISFNLIDNMTTFRKKCFDPTPGIESVCKDRKCACMVLYVPFPLIICNMTTFSNKKRPFDPTRGLRMCIMTQFVMQHNYFQKKSFDSTPGAGLC